MASTKDAARRPPAAPSAPASHGGRLADQVKPYTRALGERDPCHGTYVAHYGAKDAGVTFVAADHSMDARSPTFQAVADAFVESRPRAVIVEGLPRSAGTSPRGYVEWMRQHQDGKRFDGGEAGYAAILANDRSIPFMGGEPDEPEVAREVIGAGFKAEDLLGYYFVREVPTFRPEERVDPAAVERRFREIVDVQAKEAGLSDEAARFTFPAFSRWYESHFGKGFEAADLQNGDIEPLADGPLITQRVSAAADRARNRSLANVIEAELAKGGGDLLVVYGTGHLSTLRDGLENALGEATNVCWVPDSTEPAE